MNNDHKINGDEVNEQVICEEEADCEEDYDSFGSDDGRVGATSPTPAHASTSKGGYINEVNKTDKFYCSGVVTSAFDFSKPWEDPEYSFPGSHTVNASVNHPQKAFEKRRKDGGEWYVVHTLCKDCFKLDRANEEELQGFYTSGMSEEQYFRFCRPKHLRREKKLLANKRQRLVAESVQETAPTDDSYVTPVKSRQPSSMASSDSQPAATTAPSQTKHSKVAALLRETASAVKAAKESSEWTKADVLAIKPISFDEAAALRTPTTAIPGTASTPSAPAITGSSVAPAPTTAPRPVTLADIAPKLANWVNSVRKGLKVSDLKDLCRANALMVSGTKNELLDRLMKCKLHGGPGACPWCRQNKLEWTYHSEEVTALPMSVKCKHFAYFDKTYCSYQYDSFPSSYFLQAKARPQYHAKPLKDTAEGVLRSKGINTGSFFA